MCTGPNHLFLRIIFINEPQGTRSPVFSIGSCQLTHVTVFFFFTFKPGGARLETVTFPKVPGERERKRPREFEEQKKIPTSIWVSSKQNKDGT